MAECQGNYIPKVNPPTAHNISDFHPIALLNVGGKLFFSLVFRHLGKHLISNSKFINKSIQKVYMEKVSVLGTHLNGLGSSEKSQIQKHIFSNNMA